MTKGGCGRRRPDVDVRAVDDAVVGTFEVVGAAHYLLGKLDDLERALVGIELTPCPSRRRRADDERFRGSDGVLLRAFRSSGGSRP